MRSNSHKIFRFLVRLILDLLGRVETHGFENAPAQGGYVIAANHVGRLDASLPYYILNRADIIMVVAEKYQKYAFYRWLVRLTNGMFIDRYNMDIAAIRETLRRLQQGQILAITPEGTRSRSGNLQEARSGAIYLAWKAGVPILPVALTGCEDAVVMERLKHFKRLHIKAVAGGIFSLPHTLDGMNRNAALQQYTDEVMCRIAALLPPDRRGVYADHPRLREFFHQESNDRQPN